VIEREKSPEDLGAEIAEQLAREEAQRRFGGARMQPDVVPPARSGPPPRRSTALPPPHKAAGSGRALASSASSAEADRLAKLYGDPSRGGPELRTPDRTKEDALGQFKRGAKICYERALKANPTMTNVKVEVAINVGVDGSANADIPMPYRADRFGGCLSGLIHKLSWPQKGDGYVLQVPLLFSGS
jgi:hypothetical protein